MKDNIQLEAQKRTIKGKEVAVLRKEGLLPAAIFGIKGNLNISLNKKVFLKIFEKSQYTSIIEIKLKDETHNVLTSEIQVHPVTNEVLNVTFHEVSLTEKVNTDVPIELIGEAPAIKTYNGILIHSIQEIEIEALPKNIPQSIDIDISGLIDIGDSILVKDIQLPEGVELVSKEEDDLDVAIVTISPPTEESVEEDVEISPEDVEIINEKKEDKSEEE